MIHLILDTNNWIYLANSIDPLTENLNEGYHFQLFEKLKLKVREKAITILVSDLVEIEWNRNQNRCFALISKHKNRMKDDLHTIDRIDRVLQSEFHDNLLDLKKAYTKHINSEIEKNQVHIEGVGRLLGDSIKYTATLETKAFASDWAVEKKAPFTGDKKNSMADALLLFSAIDYIKEVRGHYGSYPTFIFVSGNKADFCSKTSGNEIHEDLKGMVDEVGINFFLSLPEALKFVDNTLFDAAEIEVMNDDIENFRTRRFICQHCSEDDDPDGLNFIEFEEDESVVDSNAPYLDPSQLRLPFDDVVREKDLKVTILRGYCFHCETEHIKCNCGTVTMIDVFENGFECPKCGTTYLKEKLPMGDRKDHSYKLVSPEELEDSYYT